MNTSRYLVPLALASLSVAAQAQLIVPTSQSRSVRAFAEATDFGINTDTVNNVQTAADFGPFVQTVTAHATIPGVVADSGATQNSTLTGSAIMVTGSMNAQANGAFSEAIATSSFDVSFDVTATAEYSISGLVDAFDFGGTSLSLSSSNTPFYFHISAIGFSESKAFQQAGVLLPGSYTLTMSSGTGFYGDSGWAYGSGSFSCDLQISPLSGGQCEGLPNSTGTGADISNSTGNLSSGLSLSVQSGPPDKFGIFFYGAAQNAQPFGDGLLCVGAPLYRLPGAVQLSSAGSAAYSVPLHLPPANSGPSAIIPGSTWAFQFWYRDPAGPGGTGWNVSDNTTILFFP